MNTNTENVLFFEAYKSNLMKVRNSSPTGIVLPEDVTKNNFKKNRREKRRESEKAKSHLEELVRVAEEVDRELEERHLPYRFCVCVENNEVFIDVAVISEESGSSEKENVEPKYLGCLKVFLKEGMHIETISRENITDMSFSDCLGMFQSGLGLLLNKTA